MSRWTPIGLEVGRPVVYLIGSLRNPEVPKVARRLREIGYEVFDDWHAAGPTADDEWQKYETQRGRTYAEALEGYAVNHTFDYDHHHLNRADLGVLVMPAGKSGHLELGYLIGKGKPGYILFDKEPERWDAMYRFANRVFFNGDDLIHTLREARSYVPNPLRQGRPGYVRAA